MHVRVTRVTDEGTFPIAAKHPAKTPARTARNSGSPAQPPRAAVRHASVVKHAREKQSERKSAACSQHAQSLPMGRELEIGPFLPALGRRGTDFCPHGSARGQHLLVHLRRQLLESVLEL